MTIAIIGGEGKMGRFLAKLLEAHGIKVFPVGRQTKDVKKIIKSADCVIFAVQLAAFTDAVEGIKKLNLEADLKKKLLIDLSSQVSKNIETLKSLSSNAAFVHFLFGPDIQIIKNQHIIVSNTDDKILSELKSIFKKEGAIVTASSPEHHDEMMALVQALSQFSSIALAKTISESGSNKKELDDFSTVTFSLNAAVISRIISQNPELWASIQFLNPFFKDILKKHIKNIEVLAGYVEKKDYLGFAEMFKSLAIFWQEQKLTISTEQDVPEKISKNSLGVLGPKGSYSQQAALQYDKKAKVAFFDSIPELIEAVATSRVSKAIVPFENSIHGTYFEAFDAIYYRDLKIIDQTVVTVRHVIAGLDRKIPDKDIQFIYSHPQALGQCAGYLRKHYPKAKLVLTTSTSAAFKKILDDGLTNSLAVGPKLAAELYSLSIIQEDIQDVSNNQTLFVVITKKSKFHPLPYTLMVIHPTKDKPGLLHDILSIFKDKNINILKLESRPARDNLGVYIFYIKAEISNRDKKLGGILKRLKTFGAITLITN